ncbi:galactoside alpha-(1,2)-fucosyltransferase 2-like [Littorina saxatilis]|uniref:galactoside alpha-(1,2)-fucosyltransferase 2-like n=1 Tax=Littorina saxatilis TaxID=31220 RepID=UPI0038B54F97
MNRQTITRLFGAVCLASIVFSVYVIQHKTLLTTAASARSECWPLFFASPSSSSSSSSERSPLSALSSTFSVTSLPSPSPPPPSPSLSLENASSKPPTQSSNSFTRVLCVYFTGRLGNELFEYASTLGLALTLKRLPVFLGSQYLPFTLTSFNQTSASFSRFQNRCKLSARASEVSCCKFEEKLTRLNSSQDFTIGLYLQSYRYFQDHEAVIRQTLTFTDEIRSESSKVVQELRQNHSTSPLIGVHVRRGDLASEPNRKLGYPQVSSDYLNRSMAFFRSRYPDCVFVVGSDSPEWCKENILSGHHVHYLTAHSPAVDMHVLSSLDHTVITFGTFSWWIGFFNAGTTVYMKDFIVNGSWLGGAFNPDGMDYIYPGWIPL